MKWVILFFPLFINLNSIAKDYPYSNPDESADETDVSPEAVEEETAPVKGKGKKRTKKEQIFQGTQALDRFEKEIGIKSQYQLEGNSLEVDPD